MKYAKEEKEKAMKELKKILAPGATAYTILRHVSSTGMQRKISIVAIEGNEIVNLDFLVSRVLDYRIDQKKGGLVVSGCGMDMGFHLINSLSYAIHGKAGQAPHRAGYTLNHRWL